MEHIPVAEAAHNGMGTVMNHKAFGCHAEEALQAVQSEALRLENLLSRFMPGSDIGRLNQSAGVQPAKMSAETFCVLEEAVRLSELSDGLFDATVGPLVDLWDYKHASVPPADDKIRQAVSRIDFRCLKLNAAEKTAMLERRGQSLDLGGVGKGYASDCFMKRFQDFGITSAFSNIGGNVSTLGRRPDGSPWRIGIRHPRQDGLIGAVEVVGQAVVTSGDYERFFIDRFGRRYHHILNPLTGYPADAGLISVTVVSDSAMTADALSTAVFVAGLEKGLELIGKSPPAQAVLIDENLRLYVTSGLSDCLRVIDGISKSSV